VSPGFAWGLVAGLAAAALFGVAAVAQAHAQMGEAGRAREPLARGKQSVLDMKEPALSRGLALVAVAEAWLGDASAALGTAGRLPEDARASVIAEWCFLLADRYFQCRRNMNSS
jgi:hypothetical protein